MASEIGHYALILSLAIAILQSIVPLWGAHRRDMAAMSFGSHAALGQFILIALAFACLTYTFVTSDFSNATAAANSHTAKPLLYKISGVWGNHEGSMLLWVLILAVFGAAVAAYGRYVPDALRARVLSVQGMIGAGFLSFILFTSNPFARLSPAPLDGNGLNPILQDPGLAIHPPFLYLGYVGFSMAFSFSAAALIEGKVDACWARWVRPWVLAAWCFLTIGITLGSAWAYYTLGWGGWWFWDPVENASFMPWLAGTALLHSALVTERRNALMSWTILLGILTFSLSLVGTFLVRSGVLTSVHAFAQDPARGVFILALLVIATGGALVLYAVRMPALKEGSPFAPVSREGGLIVNNMFLTAAAATVFLGTFYPLVIDLIGNDKISVGPPYYNLTFVPIMIPLLMVVAVGPFLKWKRARIADALGNLKWPGLIALAAMLIMVAATYGRSLGPGLAMGLAVWLVAGAMAVLAYRIRLARVPLRKSWELAAGTPRSVYGLVIAHGGLGLAIAGITGISAWSSEAILAMRPQQTTAIAGYDVRLLGVHRVMGPNYSADRAEFEVTYNGTPVTSLASERRFYPVREQQTTSAGIRTNLISNLYVAIGEPDSNGAWTVRIYHHPLAPWIWLGGFIMALGGFVSLADRRLRVGAPQPARRALPIAPMLVEKPS
ncbi:MAG: heme lyase CcmF/NrfE family subunit [Rhodomicrobium sp.]|nr:heme lyase CcmF/NrfE family subunit [Rhodomicrobium sp.]